jgi:nitrogenase subunit NifH
MAKRSVKPNDGETRFGPMNDQVVGQGVLYIESGGPTAKTGAIGLGSVVAFDSRAASTGAAKTWYIWFDSLGNLRGSATFPTNTETSGVVISLTPAV